MLVNVVMVTAAAASIIAAAYKACGLRANPRNPSLRALVSGLFVLGLSIATAAPVVYTPVNEAIGIPNLLRVTTHLGMIAFSVAITVMRLYVAYPAEEATPRARRRVVTYVAAGVTMAVLFVAAPVDEDRVDWTVHYGDEPIVQFYLMVYLLTFGSAIFEIARLSHRTAKFLPAAPLRTGMRFTAIGASLGVAYAVYKAAYVAWSALGLRMPGPLAWLDREDLVSPLLATPGALLMVIGLTLPSWLPTLRAGWTAIGLRRTYRHLYQLWLPLYHAEPEILFGPMPPARPGLRPGRLAKLVERRAIEIPDGMLRLAAYYDPAVQAAAEASATRAGLTGDEARAEIAAACIRDALDAVRTGRKPDTPAVLELAGATTLADEISWLELVARAYRRHATAAPRTRSAEAVTAP
ncbi:MAB_1171c family putative transporter [Micromonospora sp. NPDC023633]|uniref:MAB_1171c family putative transporter n=1 Tax=Micromonospora sp. NPDC023633 TaxID=3154320 RepID=UPI0033F10154